jgi:predicted TIM-barrel fold metal-dependent hydrolase
MTRHPGQFIGFGSVDPWKGRAAVNEAKRCAELGLRGLKFMPNMQQFFPNEERFYPLWEAAQGLGLVVLFHTGTTGVGAARPGGGGIKLKYSQPIPYVDDVAADFHSSTSSWLTLPGHGGRAAGRPGAQTQRLHGPLRLVAEVLQPSLVQYANTLLQDKVLFGSDYPVISPERWLRDFEQAGFRAEVRPKILLENAAKLLGVDL